MLSLHFFRILSKSQVPSFADIGWVLFSFLGPRGDTNAEVFCCFLSLIGTNLISFIHSGKSLSIPGYSGKHSLNKQSLISLLE